MTPYTLEDFGRAEYATVYARQKALVEARLQDTGGDVLLLGEHEPVITLGRGARQENLLHPTVPIIAIERGGDVTYHGPGQLVAYPILALPADRRDLHRYLRDLETVVILTLEALGLKGERQAGATGVWISQGETSRKIASIGVAVKRWVTYHGVALNISTDLTAFQQMNPCGFPSGVMTSVQKAGRPDVTVAKVKPLFQHAFEAIFGYLSHNTTIG